MDPANLRLHDRQSNQIAFEADQKTVDALFREWLFNETAQASKRHVERPTGLEREIGTRFLHPGQAGTRSLQIKARMRSALTGYRHKRQYQATCAISDGQGSIFA